MTVRLFNLDKWARLEPGNILELVANDTRRIRLEFNCPAPTRIDVLGADDSVTFLAVVEGHQVVEFYGNATTHVIATSDDDVFYFTNDGENVATDSPDAVSFVKIAGRRERNPELERMMFKLEQNMMRRIDAEKAALEMARAAPPMEEADAVRDGTTDGTEGEAEVAALEPADVPPQGAAPKS